MLFEKFIQRCFHKFHSKNSYFKICLVTLKRNRSYASLEDEIRITLFRGVVRRVILTLGKPFLCKDFDCYFFRLSPVFSLVFHHLSERTGAYDTVFISKFPKTSERLGFILRP